MKTKILSLFTGIPGSYQPMIQLTKQILDTVGLKVGDDIEVDIAMTGGGLIVHKLVSQRVGDEVI